VQQWVRHSLMFCEVLNCRSGGVQANLPLLKSLTVSCWVCPRGRTQIPHQLLFWLGCPQRHTWHGFSSSQQCASSCGGPSPQITWWGGPCRDSQLTAMHGNFTEIFTALMHFLEICQRIPKLLGRR